LPDADTVLREGSDAMKLDGIHHVTAITGDARLNLDFYTRVMGMRLVAKSVNQDHTSVYHLFYSDEHGSPGADLTFFDYPGALPGTAGAGMVHRIVWRVADDAALDFWEARLSQEGLTVDRDATALRFADPEGLGHELVISEVPDEPLIAEHPEVPREVALRGFEGVRAYSIDPDASRQLLENTLQATSAGDSTWELRGERRGGWIAYDPPPAERGSQSAGTVHHVAWFAVHDHERWPAALRAAGVQSTPVIDRHFFKSVYFREPSGVLFEIADDGPGFAVDIPESEMGKAIVLTPELEPYRDQIEKSLMPLPDPRADWAQQH
jgi:glyoxalase family protein